MLSNADKMLLFNEFFVSPLSDEPNIDKITKETKANIKEKIMA